MNADALLPWSLSVALLAVRLTVAIALSPALAAYGLPAMVRVALMLALATLAFANREPVPAAIEWVGDPARLLLPVATEIFIGALLGLGVHLLLGAFALAGRMLDVQIGFAIGSIFDPVTHTSSNVLGALVSLIGVTLFFVSDAYLQLAQLVSQSIDVLPLGQWPALDDPMQPLLAAGSMFSLGVALAAPVAMSLLLTDMAIGVVSRNMPQVNVLVLAIPVKVIVGYAVLALSVRGWAPLIQQGFSQMTALAGTR
jgi:flagellar biosynthetic protein FliR